MTEEEMTNLNPNDLIAERRAKLAHLRTQGQAFPNDFKPDAFAADLHGEYNPLENDALEATPVSVKMAGRVMLRRLMGKASFVTIQDMTGQMQAYLKADALPEEQYEAFKKWDLGDIVAIEGTLFKTKTGELSIKAASIALLVKAIRPLPDKFHGLTDTEAKYRQRYLDLITNPETRETFVIRSKTIASIREFLVSQRFIEVETPMMQVMPGGAAARPFVTHHNALNMALYLRIAPELYLKRLLVGGFDRVFEINRNFRNEGVSVRHNPEFTMLEFYQAYATVEDGLKATEDMLRHAAMASLGRLDFEYQGAKLDFAKPFVRITVFDSILKYNPSVTAAALKTLEGARRICESLGIAFKPTDGLGKLQIEIFEKTVEDKLIEPTFVTQYPAEVSPLARANDHDPFVTDRFELMIVGRELANGFSELNDPDDQAARFLAQAQAKEAGDDEAMIYDEAFVTALEYGMPPASGVGIGIDRLVMLFANAPSIRDVILFPHMRPV